MGGSDSEGDDGETLESTTTTKPLDKNRESKFGTSSKSIAKD